MRTENFEILIPSRYAAPAAFAQVFAFTSGAIGSRIPDNIIWRKALRNNLVTNILLDIVANPVLAESQDHINPFSHVYRHPARQGHFSVKNGILFMKEIFQNDVKYVSLQIVPISLVNTVFVALHANPIGGHFNFYCTYHNICQRYFWPGMWQYIKRMCKACLGCSRSNLTKKQMRQLDIQFLI